MTWSLFNTGLAGVIFLAAIWSVSKMNGTTCHAVRIAILLILVSAGGQVLGVATGAWDHYLDTLLYSGVLLFLIFNRRYQRA